MIAIPPVVSLLVWAVVAAVLSAAAVYHADDQQELAALCGMAYLWPIFAVLAIIFSPILIGVRIGYAIKRRSEKP